jgi:hypothetical protein
VNLRVAVDVVKKRNGLASVLVVEPISSRIAG